MLGKLQYVILVLNKQLTFSTSSCSPLKVILSTLAFTAFELPPNGAIGTKILEFLFHSRSDLVRTLFSIHVVTVACVLSSSLWSESVCMCFLNDVSVTLLMAGQHQKHWWGCCDWCCSFSIFFSFCSAGILIVDIKKMILKIK